MVPDPPSSRRRALALRIGVAVIAALCAALVAAAALVPAPPEVLPLIVVVGVGCPMAAVYELSRAIAALRGAGAGAALSASDPRAVADLRRQLDALPETPHPLGL